MNQRQRQALTFLAEHARATGGGSPSYRELQRAIGYRSISGAHKVVKDLVAAGLLRVIPGRRRSIEILALSLPREAFLAAADAYTQELRRRGRAGDAATNRLIEAHSRWHDAVGGAEASARQIDIEDSARRVA